MVCTRPASSPSRGRSVTPPGTSTHGRSWLAGERHHHGGQPLVARRDAEHAVTRRKRSNQPPEDRRGIVPIGEAVEHGRRALRTAIARIGAGRSEGDRARAFEFARRGLHQQADLPVPGVIAESDRRSVRRADSAVGGEDQELLSADGGGLPSHPGVLRPAEDIARGARAEHLLGERERARRSRNVCRHVKERRVFDLELIEIQMVEPQGASHLRSKGASHPP